MPLYIAQSGDLDRCYRCLTHWLTHSQRKDRATQLLIKYKSGALVTQYSATQLVQSLKFRLSHKIIVIKHLTYRPPLFGGAYFCRVCSSCCDCKKEQKTVGGVCWTKLEIGRRVGLLGSEKVEGETPATGWHSDHLGPDHICHSVAFWSYWSWSWSWSYLPQCGIQNSDHHDHDHICHQVAN